MSQNINIQITIGGTVTVLHALAPDAGAITSADLNAFGDKLMSQLSDKIAAATASMDQAIARVQATVDSENTKIAALEQEVATGTAGQADLDAIDALKAKADAIDPTVAATLPTDGGSTTPPDPVTDPVADPAPPAA